MKVRGLTKRGKFQRVRRMKKRVRRMKKRVRRMKKRVRRMKKRARRMKKRVRSMKKKAYRERDSKWIHVDQVLHHQNIVRCMGWNLLGPLFQILLKKEDKNLNHCLAILTHILEVCSPNELLVGLLEQVEEAHPDSLAETIILLLQPLQKARRPPQWAWLSPPSVARLPVPQTKEQEEDDVFSLCRCCSALLVFVRHFVEEAKQSQQADITNGTHTAKEDELRTELLNMKSLCEPLLEGILSGIGESPPDMLCHGLLWRREVPGFLEEEVCYSKESLASLAYLLFVQHIAMDTFPTIFSSVFVLQCNMEYINLFLSRREESRLQKGLDLYEKSLVRVEDNILPVQLLEFKSFFSVPQRTKGLKVLQLSIDTFDTEAKYKFFL
ncbi:unnamed protein product [Coregonus sp. 'balchen']|nr:unnamed protein product [Coregonus sp. 'balchen']